jgi:prepilin-type N-terminal cleavage/methylation domain-containing protein
MLAIMNTNQKGFSLIELAMVLFIIGLLLGGLLTPLSTSIEQQNRRETEDNLKEIKEALLGYAVINGRLPCPDCPDDATGTCNAGTPNDGNEDRAGAPLVCRTFVGNLPWVELQIDPEDAWDNYYTYHVSSDFTRESNDAACSSVTIGVSFELCTDGTIDIWGAYNSPYGATPDVADNVVASVISHGQNFHDAVQEDQEVENYGRSPVDPDSGNDILNVYVAGDYDSNAIILREYSRVDNNISFDDLMIWISPGELMNKMVSAGKLP